MGLIIKQKITNSVVMCLIIFKSTHYPTNKIPRYCGALCLNPLGGGISAVTNQTECMPRGDKQSVCLGGIRLLQIP